MIFIDDDGQTLEYRGQFALTKQAVSLFNGSIKGDVSITFTVDNNSKNRKILGYYGPMTIDNGAFSRQSFNRVRNGVILDRGYIIIQEADNDSIKCFYISGNSNWFQKLNKLITEYDFASYVVSWTASTISSRATSTSGIIFPIADYWANGQKASNDFVLYQPNDWQTDTPNIFPEIYPAFYLKDIIKEILVQSGIKLSGNILNDVLFNSLVIGTRTAAIKRLKTVSDVYVLGAGVQAYTAGVKAKYTAWGNPITDRDNLFSSGTYTATKKTGIYIDMGTSFTQSATNYLMVYKNDAEVYAWNQTMGKGGTSAIIRVDVGDRIEIWALRSTNISFQINSISITENEWVWPGDWADPKDFLPPIMAIDLLKFVINFFGCSVYYNAYSAVLTMTIIEKLKKEDALDLSEAYISHNETYNQTAKNNYFSWIPTESDPIIDKYNKTNMTRFADGNIETASDIKENKIVAQFPFNSTKSDKNYKNMVLANVPLIRLEDNEAFEYDSSALSASLTTNGFVWSDANIKNVYNEYFKVVDEGVNRGYFISAQRTDVNIQGISKDDEGCDTGVVTIQKYTTLELFVLLSVVTKNVSDFSNVTSIRLYDETLKVKNTSLVGNLKLPDSTKSVTLTSVPYAVFTKPFFNSPIDQLKNNLAFDNPQISGFTDPTIKEQYFSKIENFFRKPKIQANMLISEATFNNYKFDRFIYLKTERLTGYFFIESFGDFVNGNTPVALTLYQL